MRNLTLSILLVFFGLNISAQSQQEILESLREQQERGFKYYYIEGLRSQLWGKTEEAFKNFQQCLQFRQDDALIYYELSNLYFSVGQNQEGFQMMQKAAELRPENRWYQLYLANLYLQSNQLMQAAQSFEKLHQNDPTNKMYLYRLGQLHTELKDYEKAIEDYEKLEVLVGSNEILEMEMRRLYSLSGKQKVTIDKLKKDIKSNPNEVMNYVILGDTYLEINDPKNAYKAYEKALKADPTFGGVYLSLANYYQATGETEKMVESLGTAFRSDGLDLESKKQVYIQFMIKAEKDSTLDSYVKEYYDILDTTYKSDAELPFYYGNYLVSHKDTLGFEYLNKSIHIDPMQRDVWLQILGNHLNNGNEDKVLETCNSALVYYPNVPEFYFYKGLVLGMQDHTKESIDVMKAGVPFAVSRKELLIRMLTTIGDMYYQVNNLDSTFLYYDKVLTLDENNILVLNNYAYFLSLTGGDLTKAEGMSAKTIQIEPGNSTYLDTYAWILYLKGDKFLSKFYIEKAITNLQGENGEILEHYGYILKLNGDNDGAKEQWKKAIELEWKTEELSKEINQLP